MDVDNINSWVSQPDVCRCCLSASGTWDVTASYITERGTKEVYSELLQECYGISLAYLAKWGPSRLVCTLCVGHLRDACSFRKQVVSAEKLFTDHCVNRKENTSDTLIKTEVDLVGRHQSPDLVGRHQSPDYFENYPDTHVADRQNENIQMKTISKDRTRNIRPASLSTHKIKRHKTNVKSKGKKQQVKLDDMDSDTPISELSKRNVQTEDQVNDDDEDLLKMTQTEKFSDRGQDYFDGQQYTRPQNIVKLVSERKRIILTCDTILKDTTACPFRHHKSWFQCFFCTQDFMEINPLRNHTLQTHPNVSEELKKIKRFPRSLQIEISNLECRHCKLNLTDIDSMRRHFVDVHNKVIYNECIADYKVDASPYDCHLCGQQFHVFRTLTTHLNEHYANCICDVCGKSFMNSKRLKVHKRTHEDGHYPCAECGKILKTKTSKANHMESAHSKRVIKCQICFQPMKHYNDRIKHMSEAHNITHKFKCPICSREYNIKHYLATHIRQTHGHKNKKCSECGMAFITNHGLKKHMLKHTGIKAYNCNICCKSYARSYTLREHMRSHENERQLLAPE